ncbi:uncharacterized protein F4812DRAFT_467848 [Daldinia caldariorum]|uniref:uncharacterized protein n=1 Tax=Daldinia caldariorum TaxID=326644 RepID=UPI0020077424|nr:uncharacterized protein F4812DRAFT_467848 [Daldinia caldariorum]KAI1471993.1 hypothetical protein F4812DRAFT_467848 [Daldinia caldariorum]
MLCPRIVNYASRWPPQEKKLLAGGCMRTITTEANPVSVPFSPLSGRSIPDSTISGSCQQTRSVNFGISAAWYERRRTRIFVHPQRKFVVQGYSVELVPWGAGEGRRHAKIVKTYTKLHPKQLRYYLSHFANWKKSVTINSISNVQDDFGLDSESFSISLSKVLEERKIAKHMQSWEDMPQFGIVDEDLPSELDTAEWCEDAWPDGLVPLSLDRIATLPRDSLSCVAREDDGTEEFSPF